MTPLTAAHIRSLLSPPAPPCVSIYMPTHRTQPTRREDPIRYADLVRAAEAEVRTKHPEHATLAIVRKLQAVPADPQFWDAKADGLAVLAAGDDVHVFRLPRACPELAVVADSYHLKPLLRVTQSADRFHVLAVSRTDARLFEGDRYSLHPVKGIVPDWNEAIGKPLNREHDPALPSGGPAGKGQIKAEEVNWFQAVDRAVLDKLTKPTNLPLVLVGLVANTAEFRKHSKNPNLVEPDVHHDPDAFTLDELRTEAWKVIQPRYTERLAKLVEGFGTAKAKGTGSADPAAIGAALVQGRVGLLLADADRVVPGRIDTSSGQIIPARLDDPAVDDLIDDLAELTLKTGGEVVVVPSDRMPSDTGVAAVYRY